MGQDCISSFSSVLYETNVSFLATESVQERSNINYSIDPQPTD